MKKRWMTALALGLILSLAACGRQVQEGIIQKKETTSVPAAEETEGTEPETEDSMKALQAEEETPRQQELRRELMIPERFVFTAGVDNGADVICRADAKILLPDAERFFQAEASMHIIDMDDMEALAYPLLGEDGLYLWEPEGYQELLETTGQLEFRLGTGEYQSEEERLVMEQQLAWYRDTLEKVEKERQKVPVPLELHAYEKAPDRNFTGLYGLTDWKRGTMELLTADYGFGISQMIQDSGVSCTISLAEARQMADGCVEAMGLSGKMACVLQQEGEPGKGWYSCHTFVYTEQVEGVRMNHILNGGSVIVKVDDRGVRQIQYSALDVDQESIQEVSLLPYAELESVLRQAIEEAWDGDGVQETLSLQVEELCLGLHWVRDTGEQDGRALSAGRLVMAWDAYGHKEYISADGGKYSAGPEAGPLFSVSAVTGEIF